MLRLPCPHVLPRLSNISSTQVNVNGQWGAICTKGTTAVRHDELATAVCRSLGQDTPGRLIGDAVFGQGSGPLWCALALPCHRP